MFLCFSTATIKPDLFGSDTRHYWLQAPTLLLHNSLQRRSGFSDRKCWGAAGREDSAVRASDAEQLPLWSVCGENMLSWPDALWDEMLLEEIQAIPQNLNCGLQLKTSSLIFTNGSSSFWFSSVTSETSRVFQPPYLHLRGQRKHKSYPSVRVQMVLLPSAPLRFLKDIFETDYGQEWQTFRKPIKNWIRYLYN